MIKTVSTRQLALQGAFDEARISSSHSLVAFVSQNPNLLDQVGVGLENPHWRGERMILLPLSAFQSCPSFPRQKNKPLQSCCSAC